MTWKDDLLVFARWTLIGAPFAFIAGAGLAVATKPIETPPAITAPSTAYKPPIIVIVTPTKENTVPRHAATEKPSTIPPVSSAPAPTVAPTSAPETTTAPPTTTSEAPATTSLPPTTTPMPTSVLDIPEPIAPSTSETPIFDQLVQEFIGRDPSFEVPGVTAQ